MQFLDFARMDFTPVSITIVLIIFQGKNHEKG